MSERRASGRAGPRLSLRCMRALPLALLLFVWSSCGLRGAAGKELMRSRCSACEAMATELQEWFYPETAPKAFTVDPEAPPKRPEEKDENGLSPETAPPPPPTAWRELPSGIGALKTIELLEGLCSKVEVYELMGRSTQNTELESREMVWQRADPNNMAHKVNPRIGEERIQIKAYCDEVLEQIEESLVDHIETGEAGPIENARTYLCEELTQECVGDVKKRLAERLAAEEKERLAKQAKEGRDVKGADPSASDKKQQPANWTDMGPGCCNGWDEGKGYPCAHPLKHTRPSMTFVCILYICQGRAHNGAPYAMPTDVVLFLLLLHVCCYTCAATRVLLHVCWLQALGAV